MNAGRVEGAIETCVLVGKFIGVLKEFQSPTFMIISFVCLKSNKTHIFCFLTAQQWYLLWGSFCCKFCVLGFAQNLGRILSSSPNSSNNHCISLLNQPQGQTFSKLVLLFEQKLDLPLGKVMVHLPTYLLTYLPTYLPIR
jgi:hypothetical protein